MALTRTVPLGERRVTLREVTVAEVRDRLAAIESCAAEVDVIRALARDDCSLDDLAWMSGASAESLEEFAPSELDELVAAARALNPHFFRVRTALAGVARVMQAEASALTSSAPSARSSSADTPGCGPTPGAPT
jgi:hypothetical protein